MSDASLRILLVGAGAVGQVYGRALQRSGARIGFFVKPAHLGEARRGYPIYPPRGPVEMLRADEVLTEIDEIAQSTWDQVWLCTSSPALRGAWLAPLLAATGQAMIVLLQPGLDDRALLLQHVPEARITAGLIGVVAWPAPLPGEQLAVPGLRCWFPIGSATLFSGPGAKLAASALRRGGCPARVVQNAGVAGALGGAVLMGVIASLELAGWTFSAWRTGPHGRSGVAAAREALAIVAAYHGTRPGMVGWLIRWPTLSLASRLAPLVAPMDIEVYLRYHFTKVGDQTRAALATWIAEGKRRGLPTAAIQKLAEGLS